MITQGTANNAQAQLKTSINASSTTLVVATGYGALFPSVFPFELTLETLNSRFKATKREIVRCTNRVGDVFTITRSYGYCPASWDSLTQTNTAFSFDADVTTVTLNVTGELIQKIITELNTKLASAGGYRTGLGLNKFLGTDASGNEIEFTQTDTQGLHTFVLGEAVSSGDALTIETPYRAVACDSTLNMGNATATQFQAFRFIANGNVTTQIYAGLKKVGAPADNLVIEIQADSAGSPSGTALQSGTTSGASLATSVANVITTITSFTGTDKTPYWIVFKRSGALDASNYYQIAVHTDDTVAFPYKTNNAGSWGSLTLTESPSIFSPGFYAQVAVKAKATLQKFCNVVLFAQTALSQYASVSVTNSRLYSGLSGLIPGRHYYLSDTAGAVALNPGTLKVYAGTAQSVSSLRIYVTTKGSAGKTDINVTTPANGVTTYSTVVPTNGCDLYYSITTATNGSSSYSGSCGVDWSQDGSNWTTLVNIGSSGAGGSASDTGILQMPVGYYRVWSASGTVAGTANIYTKSYQLNLI